MKNKMRTLPSALAIAALAGCASDPNYQGLDATPPPPPVDGGANPVQPPAGVIAAGVRWFGRVDTTTYAGQPRFAWSGTGFAAAFSGTSLAAEMTNSGSAPFFKTVIDGAPQAAFKAATGSGTYMLATGLAAGMHTVELYRQTEGPQGESRLLSLTVGDGALWIRPPGANRLIEFIGDSITCGYGNLGTSADLNNQDCFTLESAWDTYAAIAGRTLGAEVSIVAASGLGIVRNYDPTDTGPRMPMLYPRAVANATTPTWDFHVEPQVVVINLGTNDISNGKGDPGMPYVDTYVTLVADHPRLLPAHVHHLHHRAAAERLRPDDHPGPHQGRRPDGQRRRRREGRGLRPAGADPGQVGLSVPPERRREPADGRHARVGNQGEGRLVGPLTPDRRLTSRSAGRGPLRRTALARALSSGRRASGVCRETPGFD